MSVRVAYFTGEYPRATDTFIQREVAALRRLGAEVVTFAVRRPADDTMTNDAQAAERDRTTYLLPARAGALLTAHGRYLLRHPGRYRRAVALAWRTRRPGVRGALYQLFYLVEAGLLARHLETRAIPKVHNHFGDSSATVAILAACLADAEFSMTLHGPDIFFQPRQWHLGEKIDRASFCACISYFCRSQAAIFADEEHWSKLHIVHCGVDSADLKAVDHEGLGRRLLFVARLTELKGLAVLLEALATLTPSHPDIRLTVVGDGPERSRFEQRARSLGLQDQVVFVGYQPPAEVFRLLGETDVFILPSFAEGVPVVLMEAMGSAVPVIATQVGGVTELVDDGLSGYVVRPGDADQLAARLDDLLSSAPLRSRMGAAGRAKVLADFDSDVEAARLLQLFTDPATQPIRPGAPG